MCLHDVARFSAITGAWELHGRGEGCMGRGGVGRGGVPGLSARESQPERLS